MEPIKMTHMPALICGRGAVKFAATLGRKRAAVIGYTDSVEEKAREIFAGTDTEIRYIASIQREPLIGDRQPAGPTGIPAGSHPGHRRGQRDGCGQGAPFVL